MGHGGDILIGSVTFAIVFVVVGIPVSIYARLRTKDEKQKSDNFQ